MNPGAWSASLSFGRDIRTGIAMETRRVDSGRQRGGTRRLHAAPGVYVVRASAATAAGVAVATARLTVAR